MIVKDLLKACDREKLLTLITDMETADREYDEEYYQFNKRVCNGLLDDFLRIPEEESPELVLLGFTYNDREKGEVTETILMSKEDIMKKFKPKDDSWFQQADSMTLQELKDKGAEYNIIWSYAYEYADWCKSLGFELDDANVEEIGREKLMATIYYEMTYLGHTQSEIAEEHKKLDESIAEIEDQTAKGELDTIPITDVYEELGITEHELKEIHMDEEEERAFALDCLTYSIAEYAALERYQQRHQATA